MAFLSEVPQAQIESDIAEKAGRARRHIRLFAVTIAF
jgi:hypothetical protein